MILETFAFLFHTEGTNEVQKEVKDLKKSTDDVTDSNLKLKQGFQELLGVIAPLVGAYAGLRGIMDFADQNDQLWQMSQISGISARSIAELGFAMGEFGGNAQTASHMIQNLQMQIMQLRRTGSGALLQAGMMYGIGFSSDPTKMMENIARRMQSLNPMQRMDLGRMLGLDQSTILMLSKGVKNFREEMERAKRYTFINDKAVEQAHEFKRTFAEFSAILGGIGTDLAVVIMPYANEIMTYARDFLEYIKKHKFFLMEIAGIVGTIAAGLAIFEVISSPIAAVVAGLTAIAAIGEDIYGYFNGMPSLLGDIAAECPELKKNLDEIGEAVKNSWNYIKSGEMYADFKEEYDAIIDWWNNTPLEQKEAEIGLVLSEAWDNIVTKMDKYAKEINAIWKQFAEENKDTFNALANYLSGDLFKDIGKVFGNIKNDFKELLDIIQNGLSQAFEGLAEKLKNLTTLDFFQTIKDFITAIQAMFGNLWGSIQSAGSAFMAGYQETQQPMIQTMGAMQNFAMVEQANMNGRDALHQLAAVNNNRNNTLNTEVTINVQEGTRQTGIDIGNGIIDTFGNYATSTR